MSKEIKERLRHDSLLNQQKKVAACFSSQFPECGDCLNYTDATYNDVLAKIGNESPVIMPLSLGDDYFLKKFVDYSHNIADDTVFLFYIKLKDTYVFVEINGVLIKKDPAFFWGLKGQKNVSFCVLTERNGDCGFNLLYTEYGYELYIWG